MKRIITAVSVFALPLLALADSHSPVLDENLSIVEFLKRVNKHILNPIILLLFTVATLVFFWGIFEFISSSESDDAREKGKKNMLWGIIGMFIMISVYGIINLILGTFGIDAPPILNP